MEGQCETGKETSLLSRERQGLLFRWSSARGIPERSCMGIRWNRYRMATTDIEGEAAAINTGINELKDASPLSPWRGDVLRSLERNLCDTERLENVSSPETSLQVPGREKMVNKYLAMTA